MHLNKCLPFVFFSQHPHNCVFEQPGPCLWRQLSIGPLPPNNKVLTTRCWQQDPGNRVRWPGPSFVILRIPESQEQTLPQKSSNASNFQIQVSLVAVLR